MDNGEYFLNKIFFLKHNFNNNSFQLGKKIFSWKKSYASFAPQLNV